MPLGALGMPLGVQPGRPAILGPRRAGRKRAGLCFVPLAALALISGGGLPPVAADLIRLKNGNELEGRVRTLPTGDLEVFVEPGQVLVVRGAEVLSHTTREAPYDELQRRLAALGADDRDGHDRLARWAEGHRLRSSVREVYERLLRIDPHHVGARDRLGYVLYRNRWSLRTELEQRGLVRFRGLWMEPTEVDGIRTREAIEQFQKVLADVHHDNRYLRDHALLTAVKESNPQVLPFVKQVLKGADPMERLVAARVLGNFAYDEGAPELQAALLIEPREEARAAYLATLRGYRDPRLVAWMATQFQRWNDLDATARSNLVVLFQVCPHRDLLGLAVGLLDDPAWGSVIGRALARIVGGDERTAGEWLHWLRDVGPKLTDDLGTGWLAP